MGLWNQSSVRANITENKIKRFILEINIAEEKE